MQQKPPRTGLVIATLLAALLLPGWLIAQNLSVMPIGTITISGESSTNLERTADSQLAGNRQIPSLLLAATPIVTVPDDVKISRQAASDGVAELQTIDTAPDSTRKNPSEISSKSAASLETMTYASTAIIRKPTTLALATADPTTGIPITAAPTTAKPSTAVPATVTPTTSKPTTAAPTTSAPTTAKPTTAAPTTAKPTTAAPTTAAPTTAAPTTTKPTTAAPTTAKPTTAAPTTAVNTTSVSYWQSEILRLTNIERAKVGLPAYRSASSALSKASLIRSNEISQSFSHTRPDETICFSVLSECGVTYRSAGENIASCTAGRLTPAGVVKLWMDSPGHRANILHNGTVPFTSMGVGYYRSNGYDYFVQLFIG